MNAMGIKMESTQAVAPSSSDTMPSMTISVGMPMASPPTDDDVGGPVIEPLETCRAKDLRREVYRLKLRVTRKGAEMNDHKQGYIALLREYWSTKADGNGGGPLAVQQQHLEPLALPQTYMPQAQSHEATLQSLFAFAAASPQEDVGAAGAANMGHSYNLHASALQAEEKVGLAETCGYVTDGDSDASMANDCGGGSQRSIGSDCGNNSFTTIVPPRPPRVTKNDASSVHEMADWKSTSTVPVLPLIEEDRDFSLRQPLDVLIKHTQYWEGRLTVSKRKIGELQSELQASPQCDSLDLLHDEMAYYTRERKRALRSLLQDPSC